MNYTIIGYTARSIGYDGCDDTPGRLDIKTFRDKETFLSAWAKEAVTNKYDDFHILLNGIDVDNMTDEEDGAYGALEDELRSMYLPAARKEHDDKIVAERERVANAAVARARQIAAEHRAEDERQLEMLKRKLGK